MTSRYAQHILDTKHAYGTIEDTLDILHIEKKGPLMNTLECFHIYKLSREGMHLNNTYNPIFNLTAKHYKEYHTNPIPTPTTNITVTPPTYPHLLNIVINTHTRTDNMLSLLSPLPKNCR
jgi:hypothetical protein